MRTQAASDKPLSLAAVSKMLFSSTVTLACMTSRLSLICMPLAYTGPADPSSHILA